MEPEFTKNQDVSSDVLVSVVTVTFNLVKNGRIALFRECLESVHGQTYGNVEHIVVDGGSADGTVEVLEEYARKGWISYISEPDEGIYDAMNKALARVKGKYVAYLNSDDFWHDAHGIEASARALEASGADFSYAPMRLIDDAGELEGYVNPMLSAFCVDVPICHQTMFTKVETLRRFGGFDTAYRICADYDVETRMMLSGCKTVFVPLCFTTFRKGGASFDEEYARKEKLQLLWRRLAPVFGEEVVKLMSEGVFPSSVLRTLYSMLHPVVAQELACNLVPWKRGMFRLARTMGFVEQGEVLSPLCQSWKEWDGVAPRAAETEKNETAGEKSGTRRWLGPFGLPFLKVRRKSPRKTKYLLLSFIPILSVKKMYPTYGTRDTVWLLLGFLPLWRQRWRSCSSKGYLLGFFPMCSLKIR